MRSAIRQTSFVLDEITARARYQNLLDAAAQRRLRNIACATQPSWYKRLWVALQGYVVARRQWLKANTISLAGGE